MKTRAFFSIFLVVFFMGCCVSGIYKRLSKIVWNFKSQTCEKLKSENTFASHDLRLVYLNCQLSASLWFWSKSFKREVIITVIIRNIPSTLLEPYGREKRINKPENKACRTFISTQVINATPEILCSASRVKRRLISILVTP